MNAQNSLMITAKDLRQYQDDAYAYLESARQSIPTNVLSQTIQDTVSILGVVQKINPDDKLLRDGQLHTLRAIRGGVQIGLHVAELYRERSGASSFTSAHGLADTQKAELNEKMQTAAVVTLFTFARFILWDMRKLKEGNAFLENIPLELPTLDISTPRSAIMCMMYHLGKQLEREVQGSEERLVATLIGFAEAVEEAMLNRKEGLKFTEPFSSVSYTLEETDFSITGFDLIDFSGAKSISFNRVSFDSIVGNQDAKHFARRLVTRMLCYNMEAQKNVFQELGGLAPVWMGYGKPGTGKSMLIAAVATMFQEYCERVGVPFLFHPLPDNIIDSYQGNSARNMVAWMKALQDPSRITFMPIDDAENILEERTRQGVSEGVRAAIGVFLRYTEGAYAINRGNATIGVYTNLPEQVDAAVRSRIQGRMVIKGAERLEDFYDQDHLWFKRFAGEEGFVNLTPPEYKYMSAQQPLQSMADASQTRDVPAEGVVREVFDDTLRVADPSTHAFFATFYAKFMERFPAFSSRDIRNIQSAVDQRIMDFDLPEEWFLNPETFCRLAYDAQKQMIIALRKENMKGLSFAQVYAQEVIRYMDNYVQIADAQFDREVAAGVERMRIQAAVQKKLSS